MTGDANYIYRNELDKACFQHDMAYEDFKDLKRRTQSDKVLKDKAFETARNPRYEGYQRGLALMVHKCFDEKSKGTGIKNETKENQQLGNEPIIRKFKKRKVYSSFKDNIWVVDLADMQLISKYNIQYVSLICSVNMLGLFL